MSQPPLGALRVFEAVARHGSFSRAADELCVTQSAVSHQVRGLEAWFGAPLFERSRQPRDARCRTRRSSRRRSAGRSATSTRPAGGRGGPAGRRR